MPQLDYLDTDKKFIDFTKNNIDLINFCISVDSSYRNAFNEDYEGSSAELIKKHWKFNETSITKICQQIDKENSTHLAVSGHKKNPIKFDDKNNENNQGVKIIVDKIIKINNFENELKKSNPKLVDIIADAVDGISKFSFASKFCHFMCYNYFDDCRADNYCIYDKIIRRNLPVYVKRYLGKDVTTRQYEEDYNVYADDIRTLSKEVCLSKHGIDQLIWYFHK